MRRKGQALHTHEIPAEARDHVLVVRGLRTHFFSREGTLRAVDGVDFDLKPGEVLGIAGESGCGKSVTAQSILRILPAHGKTVEGRVLLNRDGEITDLLTLGEDSDEIRSIRGSEIAMIFQEPMTSFSPVHTVGNQIMEAIRLHNPGLTKQATRERAIKMLQNVGMPNPGSTIDEYSFNLSGGMRQRAMIAMALSCHPRILIADEPTTAVDVTIQAQVLELIKELQAQFGMAVMMITHDLGIIAELADRVLIMYLGKAVEFAPVDQLFSRPRHPYTQGLLKSIPKLKRGRQEVESIEGTVPSPYEALSGCPFHPRCPHFIKGTCDMAMPETIPVAENHEVACYLYDERYSREDSRDEYH